ncbi:MAG: 50S ribosomal protein L24e [Thermoplasmatota archaeon]
METKECSFCGDKIEPGTGKVFIKNDGQMFYFCNSKCEKNMLKLGRKDRETTWTKKYAQEKAVKTYHKKEKRPKKKKSK